MDVRAGLAVAELPLVTEDDAVDVAVVPEPPMETEVEAMGMDALDVAIALER